MPTGDGKTLRCLAFALHHAVRHKLKRVIVVAPYTSILEQPAQVYRYARWLTATSSSITLTSVPRGLPTAIGRPASWDAPVIVTTSVQLLEGLHAAHKRPCRKLHRIANSVILLDEVQTFPAALRQPIHAALKRLIDDFGVTVVDGTATQPLLATTPGSMRKDILRLDLQIAVREIIPTSGIHFKATRHRYRMEIMGNLDIPVDPAALAADAASQGSALIITHRRDDARTLADLLGPDCLHISAAMCAAHRTEVLAEARKRLERGEPCLLVATRLVEAGVDIDFPVV